jgi:hypothetical protein
VELCSKRLKDVDDQLDDPKLELMVTDREWEALERPVDKLQELEQEKWFQRIR